MVRLIAVTTLCALLGACVAPTPKPLTSSPAPPPLSLAPGLCESASTPLPSETLRPHQPVIGGGVVSDSDFTFSVWLYCDTTLEAQVSDESVTIGSLGAYVAWRYDGSGLSGEVSDYWGPMPSPVLRSRSPGLPQGSVNSYSGGLPIPREKLPTAERSQSELIYELTVNTERGSFGASLSFALSADPSGYIPVAVVVAVAR